MTSPAPAAHQRFSVTAQWVAATLADASGWHFDERSLAQYERILDEIDSAAAATDQTALARLYDELVTLGARLRERAPLADATGAHTTGTRHDFPERRSDELRQRLLGTPSPASGVGDAAQEEAMVLYRTVGGATPTYPAPRQRSYLSRVFLVLSLYVITTLLALLVWYGYVWLTVQRQ